MLAPALDQDLSLAKRCEDFSVRQLVAQLRIEALIVAILPRAAGLDIERLYANPPEPAAHRFGGEFAALVGPYMLRRAVDGEQLGEAMQNVVGISLRAVTMARHWRVNSSTTVSIRNARPSCV
jgi:hypothetical protein